jgi:predicted kinase
MKAEAAKAFQCAEKFVRAFERRDPRSLDNLVRGFICRKKGLMGGAIYITHVNGKATEHQLIHGTPKLFYPYTDHQGREYKQLKARSFVLSEKWNGMNVLIFQYKDSKGRLYLTAKSKGAPFLNDGEYGAFFTMFSEAFSKPTVMGRAFTLLSDVNVSAVSYELCGSQEPHLVDYDFELELKPLFKVYRDGRIAPIISYDLDNSSLVRRWVGQDDLVAKCKARQVADLETNCLHRYYNNLPVRYEYRHFATEGRVLYLLDEDGYLINRTMYKIKPIDVESVHRSHFDDSFKERVKEAVRKIILGESIVTEAALKEEMDMGPKEWYKFGDSIMSFFNEPPPQSTRSVIIMVGLPGSGKSTLAARLKGRAEAGGKTARVHSTDSYFIDSDGDYVYDKSKAPGNHKLNFDDFSRSLQDHTNLVIVDNINVEASHWKPYVELAEEQGYSVHFRIVGATDKEAIKIYEQRNTHGVNIQTLRRQAAKLRLSLIKHKDRMNFQVVL